MQHNRPIKQVNEQVDARPARVSHLAIVRAEDLTHQGEDTFAAASAEEPDGRYTEQIYKPMVNRHNFVEYLWVSSPVL